MPPRDPFREFVGESPSIRGLRALAVKAASVAAPVLLEGETGTGKSLLARLIHDASARSRAEFVPVSCPGIPEALFESQLFGHEEGAFTGAQRARPGLFQIADGGTLFLDEIGDLPLAQQAKLLLVLDEGQVRRLGVRRSERVDVRILSASSGALGAAVKAGAFRSDLLFRLALLRVRIPPLRERPEDIPLLASSLARDAGRRQLGRPAELDPAAVRVLQEREWPGNVRALRFVLEAALILRRSQRICAEGVEEALEHSAASLLI